MPVIPALLVNNKFVTDFKAKANIFNDFFSKQCTPLANGSKLPENQVYLTNSRINSVPFSDDLVINIIRNLNVNKAHGHDDISIRMIKMCDESLLRPLSIIFRNSLKSSIYPTTWKKANIIPVHKKDDKQCVNNYRPVSLLPVFGKIFEKLIFNEIYSFLDREKLLNTNQSGFRPFDSFVNQLFTIWGYSKITSPRKWQILEHPSPYVTVSHFFRYTPSPLHVTRQIVTNFFRDQTP